MLDSDEIRWVKTTANELNNLLQVISESSQVLERLKESSASPEVERYFAILRNGIERAVVVTQLMTERVGGYAEILPPELSPLPAPGAAKPAFAIASAELPPIPADIVVHNPDGPLELLLVVDDEEMVTTLATIVLTDAGYQVVTARDGFQAIDLYSRLRERIALVMLDFTMPVMDGADVFAELQMINPRVPVMLSSGFAEQERLRGMLAKGLRGFIPKPYSQQKLLTQVRSTLDALKSERTGERRIL